MRKVVVTPLSVEVTAWPRNSRVLATPSGP